MANPKTPNIGLNKIDRTSPATTYFDLEKYIDQNADSVDEFAGGVNETLTDVRQRLDTEQRKEVVLKAGMQILNAERSTVFSLSGIKGRTLVNLIGRDGKCEDVSKFLPYQSTLALDTSNKVQGNSSIKVTSTQAGSSVCAKLFSFKKGKKYLIAVLAKNGNSENDIQINIVNQSLSKILAHKDKNSFKTICSKVDIVNDVTINIDMFTTATAVGQYFYIDNVRVYEISNDEYSKLDSMTEKEIETQYPYVDSVQPVRNPYAIRYGDNLILPFYEWTSLASTAKVVSAYKITLCVTAAYQGSYCDVPVTPNTDYTFSCTHNAWIGVLASDKTTALVTDTDKQTVTFNSGTNEVIRVYFTNGVSATGEYSIESPMLTLRSTPKTFKPREDSMLALQTELYADPLTGANADEAFEKDGQYFKLAKWKKVVLDGSVDFAHIATLTGYKVFRAKGLPSAVGFNRLVATKYEGKLLTSNGNMLAADNAYFLIADLTEFQVSISSADSGWGDNYTPTPDEIKAYFMGWKMGNNNEITYPAWSGTGTKVWYKLYCGEGNKHAHATGAPIIEGSIVTAVPTTVNDMGYAPYQLVYQLETPTVEPIVSEGLLTFDEGDNQIEVGTGIVLREKATPVTINSVTDINNPSTEISFAPSRLKYKVKKMFNVYKNNRSDYWELNKDVNATGYPYYNGVFARLKGTYDSQATFSVTYLMLDTSPIASFTGTYAANEKALFQDLLDAVRGIASGAMSLGKANGIEQKNKVVAALNSIGVGASTIDSWEQLVEMISAVTRATGNAKAADVLAGKTFSNGSVNGLTGTMPNRGNTNLQSDIKNNVPIPAGYHSGGNVLPPLATPGETIVWSKSSPGQTLPATDYMYTNVNFSGPKILKSGVYRIKFGLSGGSSTNIVYGQIFKNEQPYGQMRSNYGSQVNFTEDLAFSEGDTLQFAGKCTTGTPYAYMADMKLGVASISYV